MLMRNAIYKCAPKPLWLGLWIRHQLRTGEPELRLVEHLLKDSGAMVDVGANAGIYSALALQRRRWVAAFEPVAVGAMAVAYMSGGGRFDPKKNALVLAPGQPPEAPLATAERRNYQHELNSMLAQAGPKLKPGRNEKVWAHLENSSEPQLDEYGRVTLRVRRDEEWVDVGIARENILNGGTPPDLAKELLAARLQEELRPSDSPRASQTEVMNDWNLLRSLLPPGTE